jgi:periplasmic protein TonB
MATMHQHSLRASVIVVGVLALLLAACKDAPSRPKQAQSVKLLPDTPPPPPPPKPEEKRPEPKREDKPQQQTPQPKPQPTPQQQALKSDEAPGQGAGSGLTSGAVTQDYSAGATSGTGAQVGSTEVGSNRLAANVYANAATRAINDYLNRDKELKQLDYRLQVYVWLQADGRLERAELVGSTGNTEVDAALRRALERFPGTRSPLPDRLPQPLRLQVSNRMMG